MSNSTDQHYILNRARKVTNYAVHSGHLQDANIILLDLSLQDKKGHPKKPMIGTACSIQRLNDWPHISHQPSQRQSESVK